VLLALRAKLVQLDRQVQLVLLDLRVTKVFKVRSARLVLLVRQGLGVTKVFKESLARQVHRET
jgi:hypothetical protein